MAACNPDALLLRALRNEKQERMPLWVMRQAGRYLPEYRKLRKQAGSFLNLCNSPEMACTATLQPLRRYRLDAAIVFSDILIVADALGCELGFAEGEGPFLARPAADEKMIASLAEPGVDAFAGVAATIGACRGELAEDVALIGFAGAPFTLACYMVQGSGGREFALARRLMLTEPQAFAELIDRTTRAVAACLSAQAAAGADVLMLFESWAALAAPHYLDEHVVKPAAKVIALLREAGIDLPIIVFPRNAEQVAGKMVAAGANAIGVGWQADLVEVRAAVGEQTALQGNLDPAALLADRETLRSAIARTVAAHGTGAGGRIFNLGHGIGKETDPESMAILVDAVREFSAC
ncbi:MAG: uroporphyrinogen decarboxylase [Betaproteobacteria bacterium]|nr:uroporphyrinogen decarboxylase [Betaproteobacteria bacterium]